MTEWTEHEQIAINNFLAEQGPLKTALAKFLHNLSLDEKAMCAAAMATVPRNPEQAADHAAKAQLLDEFWPLLADTLQAEKGLVMPSQEPTQRGLEE